jgi:glycosyltransferase involved in cell wall biosynthesis
LNRSSQTNKTKMPKISILIPAKNAGKYLHACIDSIIEQTETDWECIIINDNSTDDTLKILENYAKIDTRISVYSNPKSGVITALQFAYSKCNGILIHRMDADDIMPKQKLEVLKNNLLQSGKGHVATGKVEYFAETPLGDGYKKYESWLNGLTEKGGNFSELYKECVIASPCWMVYRTDFEACGGFESEIYPEDYDLVFRFYELGLKCIPCDLVLHRWRDYAIRSSRTSEHYADNRFIAIKCFYFLKLNYDNNRPLVVWGAGRKGKSIAQYLIKENTTFNWLCNNPKKIGKSIYDVLMQSEKAIETLDNPQIIIAVANHEEQAILKNYFHQRGMETMIDYFFFC